MVVACSYKILWPKIDFLIFLPHFPLSTGHFFQNVTDTSKSLRFQKTQMFSQIIDQKEHKNNRYKFEPATWCYKHHSSRQYIDCPLLSYLQCWHDSLHPQKSAPAPSPSPAAGSNRAQILGKDHIPPPLQHPLRLSG